MKNDIAKARKILSEGGYTLALVKGEQVITSAERGIRPLLRLLDTQEKLNGFSAADKVVGKAAAFLYVLLKVDCLYAEVISKPALEILQSSGVNVEYHNLAAAIRNRTNTGFCPMETAVMDISEPDEALRAIREKIADMN